MRDEREGRSIKKGGGERRKEREEIEGQIPGMANNSIKSTVISSYKVIQSFNTGFMLSDNPFSTAHSGVSRCMPSLCPTDEYPMHFPFFCL